ncbi:DUF3592 domain-containing protein [Deinococcus fonticola]|uniref:DUF3592 domain-containing protein n=1 Tax=Deinococcus fonticola TaxID=2528713 RepID=UPI0010754346|nr:DUF3592 domain-containing protein [Deinococcus fonticola]
MIVLFITLFVFFFVSVGQAEKEEYFSIQNAQKATAKVVGLYTGQGDCAIHYVYKVGGQEYHDERISLTVINRKSSFDSGLCSRTKFLVVGDWIPIRYDRANPDHVIAYSQFPFVQVLGPVVAALSWVWFIVLFIRQWKTPRR